jgi:tetratricopeptide (TPR) repeat protein
MKNLLLIFCILLSSHLIYGQYDVSKINKKAIEAYNKGLEKAQDGKFKDAIESLQEAINRDPKYIDAYLSLAGVYGQMKNHAQSVATYEKAFLIDSNYTSDYRLPYSINLAGLGQFEKALNIINILLLRTNLSPNTRKAGAYRHKTYQFAVEYAKNEAVKNYVFKPSNLGEGINTTESEYFPSLPIEF